MTMLISHRTSAYVDNGGLERAAGMLAICAKESAGENPYWAAVCDGACNAMRVLQLHDIKTAEDFMTVFDTAMYIPEEKEE